MLNPVPLSEFNPADYHRTGSRAAVKPEGNTCEHIWDNWFETTPATCMAAGVETRNCSKDCGAKETKSIPKLTEGCGEENIMELIGWEWTNWEYYKDDFGGTSIVIDNEDPLQAKLILGEQEGGDYPYLGLSTYLETGLFEKLNKIEIAYTTNGALKIGISVSCEPFDEDEWSTNITSVTYEAVLPAAGGTITLQLSDFKKPSWPTKYTGPANLGGVDKSKITAGVTFFHAVYGTTVEIEVTSLKVYLGDGQNSIPNTRRAVRSTAAMSINGFSAGRLSLNVPANGQYTVSLYSVDGRMLSQTKANLNQGVNTLSIGRNLAKGVVIVRIQGANAQLVRKLTIR
jgi:hypothetical protein